MKSRRILPLLFVACLGGVVSCSCHFNFITNDNYHYDNADKYTKYEGPVSFIDTLSELSLTYIGGTVTITAGSEFKIEESGSEHPLFYYHDKTDPNSTKMTIQYVENGTKASEYNNLNKDLTITVPHNQIKDFTINAVDCELSIDFPAVEKFNIDSVGSKGTIQIADVKKCKYNTVGSDLVTRILYTGLTERIDVNTVGGSLVFQLSTYKRINLDVDVVGTVVTNNFTSDSLLSFDFDIEGVGGNVTIDTY